MITLQFSASPDLGSKIIGFFSHGAAWSHVDAVLPDGRLLGARYDRTGITAECPDGCAPGVQIRPADYKQFSRKRKLHLPCPQPMADRFNDFLHSQLGKPYDTRALIGFATGRDWRTPDSWFCSELVARGLELSGWFPYPLATPVDKIDPDDLYLAISARDQI